MGVGQFWADLCGKGGLKWLANIQRQYYQRSLHLISVCQCLPEAQTLEEQNELKKVFTLVEGAIQAGTSREDPKQGPNRDISFDNAMKALEEYTTKFQVVANPDLWRTFGAVASADMTAQNLIENVNRKVQKKIEDMKKTKRMKMRVKFWKEEPLTWTPASSKPTYNSDECTVKIEETATLTILLHRCFEFRVIQDSDWNIHFDQYPYFYGDSPSIPSPYSKRIPSENPWKLVRDYMNFSDKGSGSPLHIILDRTNPKPISIFKNDKSVESLSLPVHYRNAWQVDTNPVTLIVRNRTPSMSLTSWTPNKPAPQGSGFASSSGTTLNDNSSTTSSLQFSVALSSSVTLAPQTNIAVAINHPAFPNPASSSSGIPPNLPMHMPVPQHVPPQPASMLSRSSASPSNISLPSTSNTPIQLSQYSGSIDFTPSVGTMVGMQPMTEEKKKKKGFLSWFSKRS
ncbi:hypothetical protein D9613_010924 [Agrocybe pediades]|uniref:Uncharacterized protein n=1 Tax=Agrocybe pediades TaxID=84607 RepID=A0A8H4QL96_9AGAR|nr:hypothetical protein D9613_010924 [Agrocybe pediades]